MANRFTVGLALSLLLSGSFSGLAFADDAQSALEKQIMNGDAAPSSGNPDNFPWMNKDGSVKPTSNASVKPAAPTNNATATPPAAKTGPVFMAPAEKPEASFDEQKKANEQKHAAEERKASTESNHSEPVREEKLKAEHAETATTQKPNSEKEKLENEKFPHFKGSPVVEHGGSEKSASSSSSGKSTMLFGRIEQLSASAGASFPSLKAQTPMMDTRGMTPLQAQATKTSLLSGSVVKSYPADYQGAWGGRLVLQQIQVSPEYYRVDPEEARRTAQAMRNGNVGQVNFNFDRSKGAIALEPARCLFMVPAGDTQVSDEVKKMMGGNAMSGMMSQVMAGMNVPIVLYFGDYQTTSGEAGVSGNQVQARVLKNEVRQLAPGVVEQQIVTQETTWNKATHRARTGYGEVVTRFTRQNATTMYVQVATVNYGADKKYLEKMVLYGSIGKGVVMNTDPMQAMNSNMPGMGGMGGMGALQNMFGGGGAARGAQTPSVPAGGIDGMLKNLFGGQ